MMPLRFLWLKCLISALILSLTACQTLPSNITWVERVTDPVRFWSSHKSSTFTYRKWLNPNQEPDTIIIGIHGFCGASSDFSNLGSYCLKKNPSTAVYAYDVRGQGNDPINIRRGDIGDPTDWYHDLAAFTRFVKNKHPHSKIVWFGESMGSMIAAHSIRASIPKGTICDALILSSPIVRIRDDIPMWQIDLIHYAAKTFPLTRIPLDALAQNKNVNVTEGLQHLDQVNHNPYHVKKHTLRLLSTLSQHILSMNDCAKNITMPTLILHGSNDYFNDDADIRSFLTNLPPQTPVRYNNYPNAYHLLMYDQQKDRIFKDISNWLNRL